MRKNKPAWERELHSRVEIQEDRIEELEGENEELSKRVENLPDDFPELATLPDRMK